jgi:hypothetical protein
MVPSKPPPPNMTTFEFHVSGSASRNWMSGAVVSTGEILRVTRQYAGIAPAPEPDAATPDAAVTTAPAVGKPIDAAGIALPVRSAQASGVAAAALSCRRRRRRRHRSRRAPRRQARQPPIRCARLEVFIGLSPCA